MYDSQKWLRNFDIVIIPNLFLSKCFWMYLHCLYIMYNIRIRIKPKENNWKLYPNRSKRSQICNRFGSGRIRFGWRFFSDRIYPWRTVLCSVHCAPHSSFKWADIDILLGIRSFSILMDACLRNAHPQNFWKIHLECNLYLCEAVPIESQFFYRGFDLSFVDAEAVRYRLNNLFGLIWTFSAVFRIRDTASAMRMLRKCSFQHRIHCLQGGCSSHVQIENWKRVSVILQSYMI